MQANLEKGGGKHSENKILTALNNQELIYLLLKANKG